MIRKTVGIVGCGAIGSALAEHIDKKLKLFVGKIILCDSDPSRAGELAGKLAGAVIAKSVDEVVENADLVIEAASPDIVPGLLERAIDGGKDAMIMSIGGLLGNEGLLDRAREKAVSVILPSGAIAGVDAIKAARIAGIESVTLTTRKPVKGVKGAPFLLEKGIDTDKITGETVVFEGNARDAMKGFPRNINVAALLSIAGIGAERTMVRIIISPEYSRNTHEIEVKSGSGNFFMRTENVPFPENPKTSYLAALAAMAAIESYFDTVRIGT